MNVLYLFGGAILLLVCILVIAAIFVPKLRYGRQRKALEQMLEGYQANEALVRYVMLNRQCSEEVAYERIATFIKRHVPLDDRSYIDKMLAQNKQNLLQNAREILLNDANEIDKI